MSTAFELADRLVEDICSINPPLATTLGVPGFDHLWGDVFGLEGVEQERQVRERYRDLIRAEIEDEDPRASLAAHVMSRSLEEADVGYEEGDHFLTLRHLGSPLHRMRTLFDVMDASTADGRGAIASRLDTMSKPLEDYKELLAEGIGERITMARRQVRSVIEQARRMSTDPASLGRIVDKVEAIGSPEEARAVAEGAAHARSAIADFADWLETEYLPGAVAADAVGRDRYVRSADRMVGLELDPDQTYQWGWEELRRLLGEMQRVAEAISPGAGMAGVKDHLENSPEETVTDTAELLAFVGDTLDRAVEDLAGSHFDVPDLIRPLTVQLAPPGGPLGVYYVGPSEDFSRPGGVWYSVGNQERFPLYQHVSTAYHEGFPGHHLQIATARSRTEEISRFQRLLTWYPGYGEGWAMYAEVLMGELGYLEDPRHYFGMLAKQAYRTARVVVDIGLHLGKRIDVTSPMAAGEEWTFETAVAFMEEYGFRTADQARDEVLRYLGWPGQAIAYKVGEREILSIRDQLMGSLGTGFDLRRFHETVLNNGAMRLDLLREVAADRMGA